MGYTWLATTSSCLAAAGTTSAQPRFHALGSLDPLLAGPSLAFGLSADGSTAVGVSSSAQGFQAFRWTRSEGMVGLGAFANPGGRLSSAAYGVSANGSVIAGSSLRPDSLNPAGSPFRWTARDGMELVPGLGGTSTGGSAIGVSRNGAIVVGNVDSSPGDYQAFKWTAPTGTEALASFPAQRFAKALATTNNGSVIVGYANIGTLEPQAVRWTGAIAEFLPVNAPGISAAAAVSADGSVIVGQSGGMAVRWVNGRVAESLGVLGPGLHCAFAVSADGSVIVGVANYDSTNHSRVAFIWDEQSGIRDLNTALPNEFGLPRPGMQLAEARGISADGLVIAGYGFTASRLEAFVADFRSHACYPDCDTSTGRGVLDIFDLLCFQNRYGVAGPYACNCDTSTGPGTCDIFDFLCFQNAFAAGCP